LADPLQAMSVSVWLPDAPLYFVASPKVVSSMPTAIPVAFATCQRWSI
jgi:hypothetical protein